MKWIHTGDLHIGKVLNEYSLIEEQKYILDEILKIIKVENADGLIIAGDIYDRSIPTAQAVGVFDDFLSKLAQNNIIVIMIAGNHDSPERIGFASSILNQGNIFVAGNYKGRLEKAQFTDQFGQVNVYLLPFMKPQVVRYYFPEEEINTYEDGVKVILKQEKINLEERNILVTHHFVINGNNEPILSDSENIISVGGIDHVDASVFEAFDYTALGHIHRPQMVKNDRIQYSGSPLKYSFSESNHAKSMVSIRLLEKGNVEIERISLNPLKDMRRLKGSLQDIMASTEGKSEDLIEVTLTDEVELIDPLHTLRSVYPNVLQLKFEKSSDGVVVRELEVADLEEKSTLELFTDFYKSVRGKELTKEHLEYLTDVIEEVEGEIQ